METKMDRKSVDFLYLLNALSLEPVDAGFVLKAMATVTFQGNKIPSRELGHEFEIGLPRLLKNDRDYTGSDKTMDEEEVWDGTLFDSIKLPSVNASHYLERRLDHKVILLTKNGSRVAALRDELTKRMENDKTDELERYSLGEIFAVSWAPGMRGTGVVNCGEKHEYGEVAVVEEEILKVSELLKWKENYDKLFTHYRQLSEKTGSGDDDPKMEVDDPETINRRKFVEEKSKEFLNPMNKMLRIIDLDDFENPDVQYKNLCSITKSYTVHWLQAFPEGFIWKLTNLGYSKFTRFNLSEISYDEANWLSHLEHKASHGVICICGIAGMGKTTFMKKIVQRLKARYENRLVCFIDLKRFGQMLDEKKVKSLEMVSFSEMLVTYFAIESRLEQSLFKTLLTSLDKSRQVPLIELLMDGLENMTDTSRSILIEFFKDDFSLYCKSSYRVWFTTRPHLKHEIEESFDIVGYNLDSLNSTDVKEYLCACNEKVNFASDLFSSSMKTYLKIDLGGLLGTPQNMIAFQEYMRLHDYPDPYTLNVNTVMREVIMTSLKRSYTQNYLDLEWESGTEPIFAKISSSHVPLAIQVSSGETAGPTDSVKMVAQLNSDEQRNMLRFGIVTKNELGQFYFVHAAYPAFILGEHFRFNSPDCGYQSDFFLNYVLAKDVCDLIRQFYNESLSMPVATSVSNEWMSLLRQFMIKAYFLSNELYDHSAPTRTTSLLQLAIIDQRLTLAKLILRCFAPNHTEECRRLIRRKVLVKINDTKQFIKVRRGTVNKRKLKKERKCLELSALSLAIILGDRELVHSMYTILGPSEKTNPHLGQWSVKDHFHFSPLHLAILGGNAETFEYLSLFQHLSTNKTDTMDYFPNHFIFFNRWIIKFPNLQLGNVPAVPPVMREVHIRKYYDDISDIDYDPGVGTTADRAGNTPILRSRLLMEYTKHAMGNNESFYMKRNAQEICHYKSYNNYVYFTESLSGRTEANFKEDSNSQIPAFHMACGAGYLPIVKIMVDKGININIRDKYNRTAVYNALCKGQVHVAEYLLEIGVDKDISSTVNDLPLLHHLAVQNRAESICFLLERFKIPVDMRAGNVDAITALHIACGTRSLNAAKVLIQNGANVNARDAEKMTPIMHAISPDVEVNIGLVNLLIKNRANLNILRSNDNTCLQQAVTRREKDLVACLINSKKVNIDGINHKGQTALHLACNVKGNKDIVEMLVKAGAKLDVLDSNGESPLFIACRENSDDEETIKYLVNQGASVTQISKKGESLVKVLTDMNPTLGNTIYPKRSHFKIPKISDKGASEKDHDTTSLNSGH